MIHGLREYDVGFASHPDACSELAEMVYDECAAFVRREPESIGGDAVPHLLERGVRDELFRDGVAVIHGLALPLESQRCQDECWRKENRDREEDDDERGAVRIQYPTFFQACILTSGARPEPRSTTPAAKPTA